MAKSKVGSKKVVAPVEATVVEASVDGPVVSVSEPVQADATSPTPVSAEIPTADKRARKGQAAEKAPVDPAAEARARWKRRLDRWAKKTAAAGVDARTLMQEALAG